MLLPMVIYHLRAFCYFWNDVHEKKNRSELYLCVNVYSLFLRQLQHTHSKNGYDRYINDILNV